jgi:hypothetical protein
MRTLVYAEDYNAYLRVCHEYNLPHTQGPRQEFNGSTAIWCRTLEAILNRPKSWPVYVVPPNSFIRAPILEAALKNREGVTYVGSTHHSPRRQGEQL